jgi:tRNA(fMet)-specific endonuclease VapC
VKRYLLDTNAVSHLIKGHPAVAQRVVEVPMASRCISAITEGELLFGLAKRQDAKRLHLGQFNQLVAWMHAFRAHAEWSRDNR